MFRYVLLSVAIVACASLSAYAITVDGNINDWVTAGLLHDDPSDDNVGKSVEILRYGATVIGDRFYAVIEMAQPLDPNLFLLRKVVFWQRRRVDRRDFIIVSDLLCEREQSRQPGQSDAADAAPISAEHP